MKDKNKKIHSRYHRYDLSALDKDIDCRRYAVFALHMQPGGKPYEEQAEQIDAILQTDKPIAFPCPSRTHQLAGEGDYTHFYVYPHYAICYSGKCNLHEYDGQEKWLRPGNGNTIDWKTLGYLYKRNVIGIPPEKIHLGDLAGEAAEEAGGADLYVLDEGKEGPYETFPYTYEEMDLVGLIYKSRTIYTEDDAEASVMRRAEKSVSSMEELRSWYFSDRSSFETYLRDKCVETFIRLEGLWDEKNEPESIESYSLREKVLRGKRMLYGISEKMGLTHERPHVRYW